MQCQVQGEEEFAPEDKQAFHSEPQGVSRLNVNCTNYERNQLKNLNESHLFTF